ncbi:MAG: glycosyltransferase family 4 protein [Ardenticatenaceae bacterium]|nr:glycosyltransferase family 4 protein [Ardenticatenaceae bacterium]
MLWAYSQNRPQTVSLRVLSVQQQPTSFYADFDARAPFPIDRVPPGRKRGATSLDFLRRFGRIVRQWQPDIALSGVAYPTAILARLIHLIYRLPYVVYAHSEDVTIGRPLARWGLGWALRGATAVLTVSQFTVNELRKLGVPPERIHLVSPGIDVQPFTEAHPHAAWPGKWVLLTVARLVARKGQDTVIRALPQVLKSVPNAHYVIVGGGPDEAYLRQLAAELGVAGHVTFAGHVADAELPAYYARCDAFAMLTRQGAGEVEGFGITFLEAGAAGKPVIGGQAGGVADAVANGVTGLLVDPLDGRAVAEAITRLARDPALAQRMGAAGRARVLENYTTAVFARKVTAVLEM